MVKFTFSFHSLLTVVALAGTLTGLPRHCVAQVAAPEVAAPTRPVAPTAHPVTVRTQQWLKATLAQRVRLAEELGEEGARAFAKAKSWQPIFDGTRRSIPQGVDQVYRGAKGLTHVIEAKGGSGQLGHAYGHPQASPDWAVEAAKRTIRSSRASAAEKAAAEAVLKAAAKGKLHVHVVRTSHVLGEPATAVLQQSARTSETASRLAQSAVDDLAKAAAQVTEDTGRLAKDASRVAPKGSGTALRTVAKGALLVGVAVDTGFRVNDGIETERRFEAGEISVHEREIAHAKNVAGMAGGWGGAIAGGKIGAIGGAAGGSCIAPGPGTAIGGVVGGVAGGAAGYFGGEAAAETTASMP